jgi:hypothetical protein
MKSFLVLLAALLFTGGLSARPEMKSESHRMLKRTSSVVLLAQQSLKSGKTYTGDFAKAVAHQRFAKKLYLRRNYAGAAHHSKVSRTLAFRVIQANRGTVAQEWELDAGETALLEGSLSDSVLEEELMKTNSDVNLREDEVVTESLSDLEMEAIPGQ